MKTSSFEEQLRTQWRDLPRATRWKLIGGVTMMFNSLAAQVFLVWLYAHFSGPQLQPLFPYLTGWPLDMWMRIVALTIDDARRKQAVDALALSVLIWALFVAWVLWRETKPRRVLDVENC